MPTDGSFRILGMEVNLAHSNIGLQGRGQQILSQGGCKGWRSEVLSTQWGYQPPSWGEGGESTGSRRYPDPYSADVQPCALLAAPRLGPRQPAGSDDAPAGEAAFAPQSRLPLTGQGHLIPD